MLLTELSTARIPDVYQQFAAVIGDCPWRSRIGQLKQEIRGNRFLAQHLESENALPCCEFCCSGVVDHGGVAQAVLGKAEAPSTWCIQESG
jgi:hypothetical protein